MVKNGSKKRILGQKRPKIQKKIPKKFWRFCMEFDINLTRDEFLGQKWLNYREKSRIFVKKRRRSQDLVCTEMRYSMLFCSVFVSHGTKNIVGKFPTQNGLRNAKKYSDF